MAKLRSLFKGEKVYDDFRHPDLIGTKSKDGWRVVDAGGEPRLLSRIPPPDDHDPREYSREMHAMEVIPRSEWSPRLKEQLEKKCRTSDFQNFPPHDQNGTPQCWANGPSQAGTTLRVMMGLPYVQLSPASLAIVISGGTSGGFEGSALKLAADKGWAPSDLVPEHSTSRALMSDPKVIASRSNFKALEWVDCGSDYDKFGTSCLLNWPGAAAANDWSHVISVADLVEIEAGSFGLRIRNSWNGWGAKNDYGFPGYAVFREHGGPHRWTSGFALRQITPYAGPIAA